MVMTNKDVMNFDLQPFQGKAGQFILQSQYYINIAEGAVRSGKTIAVIYRFIISLMKSVGINYAICGKTVKTCHVNVILPMLRILKTNGIDFLYFRESEITIFFKECTKHIYIFGANDRESKNKIAGMTLQAILIDEASRCDKEFFEMALTRLSEPEAKAFITTNPDNAMHWLKTEYIDSKHLKERGKIGVWTFYLSDNYTLTEEVVDNITETARGNPVLYARLIEAKWVSSTGLIYSNFDLEENTFNTIDLNKYDRIDIGCDYGSSNVNVFVVVGRYMQDGISYHDIIDEIVFNAQKNGYEQTDTDRCKDLYTLQQKYNLHNNNFVYVPHDATSLHAAIFQDSDLIVSSIKVKPDTLEWIYTLQDLFYQNRIRVYTGCTETLRSLSSYVWDEKKVQRGEDYPDKTCYDHPCDAFRFPIIKNLWNKVNEEALPEYIQLW